MLVTLKEQEFIQNNIMTTNHLELINFIKRSDYRFHPFIFRFYPFTKTHLSKYKDKLWWGFISENKNINWTPQLISQYKDLFEWEDRIWKNSSLPISIDFIETNNYTINYYDLAFNKGTHWNDKFINHFKGKWNWHYILLNESIDWTQKLFVELDLFKKRISITNGKTLWTEAFILNNMDKFDWFFLSQNPYLPWTEELIEKLLPVWSSSFWNGITINTGIPWSVEFIEKYVETGLKTDLALKWSGLSLNESLPWSSDLIERFIKKWDWEVLSGNNGVAFTANQIAKHKDKIIWKRKHPNFGALSDNTSLRWSEELIDAFIENWDWDDLSKNEGVRWTEKMIIKYWDKLNLNELFRNPSLPWSFAFLMKFENEIFNAWTMDSHTEKCRQIIWNKVFENILDDEMIDVLLN